MSFIGGFGTDQDIDGKVPPIGSIMPVVITTAGCPAPGPRWEVCDGNPYPASSPMFGANKPNLNAGKRFLRGSTTSGTTGGTETHSHSLTVTVGGVTPGAGGFDSTTDTQGTLPSYYEVVFYVRVR